jgi:selenocysteine lyase/cysteine desulfurase
LTDDARLHDVSLSWFAAAGARESLGLILSLGPEAIAAHNINLASEFTTALDLDDPESPIVQVTVADPNRVRERLEAAGVTCAVRDGSIRVAFHLYNDSNDVALAADPLRAERGRDAF